jgi:hypothetical protein
MRVWRTTWWMVAVIASLSMAIAAEDEPPCLKEAQRVCGMIPGAGSYVEDCLEAHGSEVSAACRKNLGDVTASADAIRAACDSDLSRYCDNDGQGHAAGQEMTCLLARRDKLSERCRTRIDKVFAASSE